MLWYSIRTQSDIKQGKIKQTVALLTSISSLSINSAKRNIQQKQLLSKNAVQFKKSCRNCCLTVFNHTSLTPYITYKPTSSPMAKKLFWRYYKWCFRVPGTSWKISKNVDDSSGSWGRMFIFHPIKGFLYFKIVIYKMKNVARASCKDYRTKITPL